MNRRVASLVQEELVATVRDPRRLAGLANRSRLHRLWFRLHPPEAGEWTASPREGFLQRGYATYEAYLKHQRSKLPLLDLREYDTEFCRALTARLADTGISWQGRSVLCLAARLGTEVKAFGQVGAFAVGIDVNPGKNNPYVLVGDFHDLRFPSASVDAVYTNSLDHAFDLGQVIEEIRRVLKPDGLAVIEVVSGEHLARSVEKNPDDKWEAVYWKQEEAVAEQFLQRGFTLDSQRAFDCPWPGTQFCLRPTPVQRPHNERGSAVDVDR